jgi:hypothetical protein
MSRAVPQVLRHGVGVVVPAALLSGLPSTVHSLLVGRDPLEASLAAGSILLPKERRRAPLLIAAVPVHLSLSAAWAVVLTVALPGERPVVEGIVAGVVIAAFDLGVVGRRFPRVRALDLAPQLADHIAFGIVAAVALARQDR